MARATIAVISPVFIVSEVEPGPAAMSSLRMDTL